jgi:uncharacterized membrane protein
VQNPFRPLRMETDVATTTTTVTLDDITGQPGASTLQFGFDGQQYEIDLTDEHRRGFEDLLSDYVKNARPVKSKPSERRRSAASGSRSHQDSQKIREWARGQGMDVPERGRLRGEVVEAYQQAHA